MKRAYALVAAQLLLLAWLILAPRGQWWALDIVTLVIAGVLGVVGAALVILGALGLGSALTPSPIPRRDAHLVTNGVYGIVRNPIYSGLLLGGLGLVVFGASVWHVVAWIALLILLMVKARWEERMLAARYPEFRAYASRVGRFVPGIGRSTGGRGPPSALR